MRLHLAVLCTLVMAGDVGAAPPRWEYGLHYSLRTGTEPFDTLPLGAHASVRAAKHLVLELDVDSFQGPVHEQLDYGLFAMHMQRRMLPISIGAALACGAPMELRVGGGAGVTYESIWLGDTSDDVEHDPNDGGDKWRPHAFATARIAYRFGPEDLQLTGGIAFRVVRTFGDGPHRMPDVPRFGTLAAQSMFMLSIAR